MAGMKTPALPAAIAALDVGFHELFTDGYADNAGVWGEQIASFVPSLSSEDLYGWFERKLKLRKWLGPRVARNLAVQTYRLKNEKYEGTISVDVDSIEDAKTLQADKFAVRELGRASRKWPQQLLKTTLQAGTSGLGYDGVAFFATTHSSLSGSNQSNLFTSSAFNQTNLNTVVTSMASIVDATGEPMEEEYDTLIVPTALASAARTLMNSETITDFVGGTGAHVANPWRGRFRVLEISALNNEPTVWYLAALGEQLKPLIFQMRKAPSDIISLTNTDDPNVFFNDEFFWGVKGRGASGYGPWWKMARAIA